jgi:peptide-methionine (S)-S-oxide reductase
MRQEKAILAGGCYWGVQELIGRQTGVISTRVGYSGGKTPSPTDDSLGDHAEAVEVVYDADTLSYRDLLEFFFQVHDPTTLNRQGDEVGRYVRSAIFYNSEEQRLTAVGTIADVEASGLWPGKVVTEVAAAGPFWEAEEDDQDYLQKHPGTEMCHFIRPGWKLPSGKLRRHNDQSRAIKPGRLTRVGLVGRVFCGCAACRCDAGRPP